MNIIENAISGGMHPNLAKNGKNLPHKYPLDDGTEEIFDHFDDVAKQTFHANHPNYTQRVQELIE